jgi:acyl-CoA synthetase (AMP-forming)/AMP-acid ligase II
LTFAPNFLFAKITHDLGAQADLHGTFDLSSRRRFNSGGEAVVSKTAVAFYEMMKKLSGDPSKLNFTVSPGFGMTETW